MIKSLIQTNYACVLICIFLFIMLLVDRSFEKKVRILFGVAVITSFILIFVDSIDYYIAQGAEPMLLRSFTTAIGYSFRPFTAMCIALLVRRHERKTYIITCVPVIFNAILNFVSIFTGIVFRFDVQNEFRRGPLGAVPFIISGFYIVLMILWTIQEFKKNGLAEMMTIIIIGFASVLATGIESIFGMKFILNGTIIVSLAAFYLFLHIQVYKRDALTNLLNRRSFYLDADSLKGTPMAIASIDINNLKKINDTSGHEAGDTAITTVVDALRNNISRGCTLYRTGGDEFMLLCKRTTYDEVKEMLEKARNVLSDTGYSFSSGVASYEPGMNFQNVCIVADEIMYENKRKSKLGR